MQENVSEQEAVETMCILQLKFCESLLEQVKIGGTMLLFPTASTKSCEPESVVNVPGLCVACGLLFVASDVVCLYTLACGHQYHALCFARWVGTERVCASLSCERSIPESARSLLVHAGLL